MGAEIAPPFFFIGLASVSSTAAVNLLSAKVFRSRRRRRRRRRARAFYLAPPTPRRPTLPAPAQPFQLPCLPVACCAPGPGLLCLACRVAERWMHAEMVAALSQSACTCAPTLGSKHPVITHPSSQLAGLPATPSRRSRGEFVFVDPLRHAQSKSFRSSHTSKHLSLPHFIFISSIGAPHHLQQQQHQPRRSMAAAAAAARLVQPTEAAAMMKDEGWTMVDVRTPEEFSAGHSPGAINVAFMLKSDAGMTPNAKFPDEFKAACPDTSAKLLIVSASLRYASLSLSLSLYLSSLFVSFFCRGSLCALRALCLRCGAPARYPAPRGNTRAPERAGTRTTRGCCFSGVGEGGVVRLRVLCVLCICSFPK